MAIRKFIKNGNIVNIPEGQEADFVNQGYVLASQDQATAAQTAAAAGFAGAQVGAGGQADRDVYAHNATVAALPGILSGSANPVSSTNTLRDAENLNRSDAASRITDLTLIDDATRNSISSGFGSDIDALMKGILGAQTFGQTTEGQAALNDLNKLRKELGTLTADEEYQVSAAGSAAASKFHNLIQQAYIEKEQGLPKALIGAGQRGGLLSSQFAGSAAGQAIIGESFFGAGGKLDEIKSTYDRNISMLYAQQQAAAIQAEALARQTIRTGKREDFELLQKAYDRAESSHNEAMKLQQEKLNTIAGLQKIKTDAIGYFQGQLDLAKDIPAGETRTFNDPITGEEYTVKGLGVEEIDPFFTGANIVSLMKDIPEGQTKTITDPNTGRVYTLTGMQSKDAKTKTVTTTDDRGNVKITTIDPTKSGSEAIISQTVLEGAGKTKAAPVSLTIRQDTGALVGSITNEFYSKVGPDDKVSPIDYGQQMDVFITSGAGSADDFKKYFPPTRWLDVNNQDALQFFQTPKDVLNDEEEEPLFQ